MKTLIAALLLGLSLSAALAIEDGFLCRPYKNGQPAPCSLYCAYLNNGSLKWEEWAHIYSNGAPKRFCKDVLYADVPIQYNQNYKFCAWDGFYWSGWTDPLLYEGGVTDTFDLDMSIPCQTVPDPEAED